MLASICGHEAIVEILLDTNQVDVNLKDGSGRTPLVCAVTYGHDLIAKILLERGGADINYNINHDGKIEMAPPVGIGNTQEHTAVVKTLILHGADVNCADLHDFSLLSLAVQYKNKAVIKLLLEEGGADINKADYNNRTPIMHAAWRGLPAIFELLFQKGADIHVKDCDGNTFLELAMDGQSKPGWLEEFLHAKGLGSNPSAEKIMDKSNLSREHTDTGSNLSITTSTLDDKGGYRLYALKLMILFSERCSGAQLPTRCNAMCHYCQNIMRWNRVVVDESPVTEHARRGHRSGARGVGNSR